MTDYADGLMIYSTTNSVTEWAPGTPPPTRPTRKVETMRSDRRRFLWDASLSVLGAGLVGSPAARGQDSGRRPRGIAMTIGLNKIDKSHYGTDGALRGCVNDAQDINNIARLQKFECRPPLLNEQATRAAVTDGIGQAAKVLKKGDIFLLQYSGHGGQIPDVSGDEDDGLDETWCLYDGMLIDDELAALWTKFEEGVRILLLSDSCHSGTVARGKAYQMALSSGDIGPQARGKDDRPPATPTFRHLPKETLEKTYRTHKAFYDEASAKANRGMASDEDGIKASILLISGCQDNQLSADMEDNGLFTYVLKRVWESSNNRVKRNYRAFHAAIVQEMPSTQTPNFYTVGTPNADFLKLKPFTV